MVKKQNNRGWIRQILNNFFLYISMENLSNSRPSKLNNFFVGQDSIIL